MITSRILWCLKPTTHAPASRVITPRVRDHPHMNRATTRWLFLMAAVQYPFFAPNHIGGLTPSFST
jgi:hypothetical protein